MGGRGLDLPMKTVKGGGPTRGMRKVPILKRCDGRSDGKKKWKTRGRKGHVSEVKRLFQEGDSIEQYQRN